MKSYYCTNHVAKFDGIEGQLQFDKMEQFKKSFEHATSVSCI